MSKPTSRVDALRRQGAQHRADIGNKEKTERQLMNTMLSIGNVSRMSVDPLGLEKRKREETMRQFKADFPEFTSKSVAQGIAEGTAYVDENFSETAGDDFDQKAESHYGTISAEDAPRKPQKKPWWDIGGSPHLGGQSPVQYYEEIAEGEKPSTTYSERVLRTTFRMIDDLPRNEKGEYVINGIPYSHTELVGVLQPQVMQSLHPQLLRDQEYRDDLAKSMGYNNMDALLAQLDQQLADLQKQIEADTWKQQSSVAASNPSVYIPARGMLEQALSGEVEGLKAIRDARDQVAAMRKGDFRSGFAEGFDLMNVASFGLTGLGADVTMLGVLNKVKDGVPLTETESRMYSVYGIQQELDSIDNAIGTSLWRGIGQGVGASAELAPQFIAGMGLANRIFKGSAIGAKAGVAATRQAFNTSVWNGLKVGAMETMKVGGRAALNLGKYQVSGLIAAPLMPGTWASYAEKRQNQFKVVDGQLVYTPTKAWMDLYDTLVEQSTEIASERFGGGLSDVLRSTAQQFGRALQLDRIGTAIGLGGDSKYIFGFKKSDAFRAFERNVGFSGVISEPLSEVWGDITSNVLKMAVTGNGDLSALGSLDYWKTAFAVSTIYGGALQTLTIPERVQYYKGVAELGKRKREILKKVEDKELANELEMLSIDDSLMTSAKRMADLDWSRFNIKDIAAAMDYVRTEIGLQVSMGYSEEQYNLRRFANAANYIETSAYTGVDGKDETTDIYRVVTAEGNVYTIISGDISNVEEGDDLLMAVDANGERVTLAKTKGNVLLASTVEREIQQAYTDMFSSEAVRARIVVANQLFDNIEDDLTMDQATNIASSLGIVIPRVGDTVKLVDGREVVCELLSETAPGRFSAWYVDDKGIEWTLSLAFTDILSSVDSIGVEQKLMLGENITEQAQEELMEEEIADASGVNIETENASRFTEGNVINTPEGQGKVLYVTDGKYVVDLNMSDGDVGEMAQKEFTIEEIDALNANTVDEGSVASEEVAAPITPTTEEVSIDDVNEALNEVSDIKVIPRAKDGSVNFDAIDDPILFAQTFADEMGSKEAAAEAVTNMRSAEAESVKKIEKASKKATSANDIVANKKKLDATKQRITFYDDVLAELTKTKEAIPETAEVVTPPEDVQPIAESIEPSVAEVAEQVVETPSDSNERASLREDDGVEVEQTTPTAPTPQPTIKAGLVKNELSAKLTDRLQKTLDAMAQAMGVTVTFVDKKITTASGGKANARIIGNQVEISWKYRTAAIRFLMGHEFTHRMKDLSPEAYAAFEQSVKEYLGEEKWNKRVEELRSLYDRQRVPITDELVAEEVTADFVGDMAYDEQTFDKYVEGNKENTGLLASIARIFRSIADFFRNIGDKSHAKRLDNMTKKLDALIAASSEAVANGAQSEGVRYSTYATNNVGTYDANNPDIRYYLREPIFYSNAEYAVRGIKQEKATPEQWLKMIEKNGGLKAGEDKWLGLSDWLKASDKKTLSKDEVLQYIAENDIQIEEVNYADVEDSARFKELYIEYNALYYEYGRNSERAFEEMLDNYGDDFGIAFEAAGDELWIRDSEAAEVFVDINSVNDTRLQYTTDGLNNKREIALVVPTIEPWNTSDNIHFGDAGEGRAVAWIRFGETTDAEGKRVLVIDEIQSKRHQEGREKGYRDVEAEKREKAERERELAEVVLPRLAELNQLYNEKYGVGKWRDTEYDRQWRPRRVYRFLTPEEQAEHESLSIRATELQTTMPRRYGVPSAPFEKNWAELAFKRMLRYAAENGYDYVAWTTGDQQADRYDIGSVVKDIVAYDTKDADGNPIKKMKFRMNNMGTYNIATNMEGVIVKGDGEMKEGMHLSDITGKPLAEKIMNGEGEDAMVFENGKDIEAKSLEGEELHIGNEGMKAFYDQMLPSFVKKYTKKWGAEVGEVTMPALEENNTMHAVNVTDSMRESVMQGQAKFSMQHPSLLGVHNISLDKLRKVIKMGGLANPSVAVIDVDKQTHDDYGEYSLILPKNMVDARQGKNAGTWAGDAWTPTYPQVVRRMTDDKAISRFYKDIDALPEAIRSRVHLDFDSFMGGRSANALAYWYLFEEGNAPALVYIPSRYSEDITNTVEEATNGSFSMYGLTPEERAKCLDAYIAVKFNGDRSAFEEEMQARIDRLTKTIETKKSDRVKKWAQETIDSIKEYGFDYDDVAKFIRDVGYDAREKGKVNVDATITAAREQIETNNLNSGYDAWRDNLDERYGIEEYIFDGYTNSGNRRYLPHTVENASKWMKKQGRQGAVATVPSFGTFVAVSIPKMTTLESIRKRKALLGKSKEEYDAFREKWENVYYELGQKLQPDAKSYDDYGYWRLIEAVENKNPREFIKKQYGIELSEKDMAQLNEMLDAIRTEYPARYFETKFERPLQLSDFVAAVVPNDIPLDVESRLRGANVEIFEYEKGNSNSRTEAMQKASHVENARFSLQEVNTRFNEELATLTEENKDKVILSLGTPSEKLLAGGVVNKPMKLYGAKVIKKQKLHGFDLSEIKNLPLAVANPIAVFNNYQSDENRSVLTELTTKDGNFLVSLNVGKGEDIDFNIVATVFGKGDDNIVDWFNRGLATYIDKEKALDYLHHSALNAEALSNPRLISTANIIQNFENPKIEAKNSLITPEMNASYLDAVERGDMTTAQRMVMEAAKLAMPNTKVVDEDGNPKVVYHGTPNNFNAFSKEMFGVSTDRGIWGNGFYFSDSEQYAKTYEKRGDKQGKTLSVFLNIKRPLFISLRNGGNEGAMYFHELMEKHFTDDIYEDVTRTDELMSVAQERLTADIVANGYDGIVVEYTNHIDTEYVAFEPNQIKSADPVTYDDAGNIIPLSERFNPRKEDIRYSLSNRPTGLINDFAEEFESLQKEYALLDPTTIHAQHPFRIRKRKVVQKYLNYVSEVLGHNVENIVYDKTNNSHVKKLYDKLKPYLKGFKEEDYSVFVESLRNRENQASYIVGSNIIIYEINNETSFMDTVNTLSAYIHENIHRIIEKLGVDEKTLEDILEEGLLLKPDITQSYIAEYLNDPKHEQGEETLAYAIGNRIKFSKDREKLLNAIEGKITAKELFGNKNISVPLRDSYIEQIVNELHNEYESREEGEDSTGADSTNRGEVDKVDNQGLWRGYFGEEPERRGGGERRLLTPTRYSVRKDDMPFFYDEGGDVIIFDDLEDAPAEYISSAEGKPRITEETLITFIKGRHSEANMHIREETDEMKKAMKARYLDEKRKRLDGIANARTNSGKVAVILGDTAVETLSLEDQALVMIAEGEVHIVWDADKNGRKGIAGELGLSNAERTNYKSITKGATVTFEKFVHQWWESIGGYEKGIDSQNMRNALIEALSEAPTAKRAIEILRDKYDTVQREYDDAIYDIEASEERELANEEARYKQELEDINDPAKRRAYVRHYEQSVAFFEDMSAVQHTVRELESKISRLTRDAAVAQRRYERRVEAIKERNKNYTQERLDEQFEKNKAFLRKVLDERNEKLRKMAEGINEAKEAVKEVLQGSKAIKYNSREVQSLIASIDGVRTAKGLKEVYSRAERIILNAGIRQARNDMQRLLNMRLPNGQMVESWVGTQVREGRLSAAEGRRIIADMWRGTNSRGVKVSKFVDEETAKVMKYLRDNLVLPYAKRHYQEMTDADGNTTKVLSPDLEITTDVATLKGNNDMRIAELEAKLVEGTLKADERTELDARRLYNSYLNVVDYKQQIEAQNKAIEEQRELIVTQREGVESGEIDASVPKESYNILSTMYEELNDLKKSYFDKIAEFNTKVEEVLSNGRDALKEFREAQEQHRVEVIRMGLNAIGGTRVSGSPTALQKAKAVLRGSAHNSYWTFQTTLREIDRFAPNGEGEFYNYFMRMSNKATDEFISMQHAHLATLGTYIHSLWPKTKKKTAYYAFIEIMEKANTTALPTITVYERIDKDGKGHEPVRHAMCISNAMYTIAMWNQAQYKEAMQKRGITQEVINNLEAAITEVDDRYLKFMKLVIEEMLPDTRLEYDKVHRQLFGASMENIDNYFPAKIKREYLQEDMQVAENTLPSTITGSIISRRSNNAMPDIMQSFFAVLEGHLQNMDNWASTAPLIMDMQTLLSNAKFRDLLNSYMPGAKGGYGSLSEIFRKACAIRAGVYKSRQAVSDDILLGMTKGFATANISFRISTAIKQLSAAPLFAAYVADPRCAKIWAKYTWRGPLYKGKKMIEAAAEISPAFRERWESKTMGSEVLARKSREAQYGVDTQDIGKSKTRKVAEDSMDLLKKVATDVGMYPNVYVDAWVCATGVLTIYEYELSRMTNGKPEEATEEMKEEARYKAETFMNATQQSADSAFLSEVQMQRSVVTSGLTMYANASYGLHRLRLAGFQELGKQMFNKEYREAVRERYGEGALGDARKKAIYQIIAGVLGDVNFYLMGLLSKSVWALLSGGEDDEDDNPIWDWWEILKDLALTMGLNGYVGGGSVSSYFQGYDLDVTPAFNEFFKDLEKIPIWKKDEDGEKTWDGVNMWAAASIIAKFGVGVDPDTILNIILGIEGIIKQEGWEAGMKLFNEPQSAINLVAGRRRKGETVQEYVERRMRLEVIGSVPSYGEMFDEDGKFIGQGKLEKGFDWGFFKFPVGGAKDYKVRNLFKEFNERQANAVMRHVMTPMQRADIERTNEAYAKVCAELGWKTTTDPGDKGVDKTQKRYVYPQGLSAGRYKNLKKIAKEISDIRKELNRFAGSDEGYAEKLKEQHELKNKLIDKYDEFK